MTSPYIEVKNLQEAAYLINEEELKELKDILSILVKRGCSKMSVAIMPKHEIANTGVIIETCFSVNGYNPTIKVGFRMEHAADLPTVRNMDWAEEDFLEKRYTFQMSMSMPTKSTRRGTARVMLWNRVR